MAIIVYNRTKEDHSDNPNNYPIYRGKSVLGNPFTHKQLSKTLAIYQVRSREEAIARYDSYFDLQYKNNTEFKAVIDEIYKKYKRGEDVYLECYCGKGENGVKNCHGEVIEEKIKKRLLKEKMKDIKEQRLKNKKK